MWQAGRILALVAFSFTAGCATYLAERDDLQGGGASPSRKVAAVQQRLAMAQDQQAGLREDEMGVQEEREALEGELAEVDANLRSQSERLAQAQAAGKITKAQEKQRRRQLEEVTSDYQNVSLQLQTRRDASDATGAREKERQLRKLKEQIDAMNQEIGVLAP